MWIIASIPFWILGGIMFLGGLMWAKDGIVGTEPVDKSMVRFVAGMLFSAVLFVLAAKIAS